MLRSSLNIVSKVKCWDNCLPGNFCRKVVLVSTDIFTQQFCLKVHQVYADFKEFFRIFFVDFLTSSLTEKKNSNWNIFVIRSKPLKLAQNHSEIFFGETEICYFSSFFRTQPINHPLSH